MSDNDSDTLLPANSSAIERGLERAFAKLLADIDPPFPELFDPTTTPPEMLPYLAADRGVSEWKSDDSDEEKRETVARAWPIKRLAGTKRALMHAVETMLIDPKIVAWHEPDGPPGPYEFRVVGFIDRAFDADVNARLDRRLRAAKSERDSLAVTIGLRARATLNTAIALQVGEVMSIAPPIPEDFVIEHSTYSTVVSLELLESVQFYPE